jgi:hypothetical protein
VTSSNSNGLNDEIPLKNSATLKKWECLDSDTGEDLAEEVRKYHIPDFLNWKNRAAFARAFAPPAFHFGATSRLEKDLPSPSRSSRRKEAPSEKPKAESGDKLEPTHVGCYAVLR